MDFVSVRVITHDVERLATFWEQVTGLPVTRPVPVFAELRTPAGTIATGAPATAAMPGDAGPSPGVTLLARSGVERATKLSETATATLSGTDGSAVIAGAQHCQNSECRLR